MAQGFGPSGSGSSGSNGNIHGSAADHLHPHADHHHAVYAAPVAEAVFTHYSKGRPHEARGTFMGAAAGGGGFALPSGDHTLPIV